MKFKLSTIILGGVTFLLLIMVIYIGTLLVGEKPTPATTIKKTKASSITYSKTVSLDYPSNTPIPSQAALVFPTSTPSPTSAVITLPTTIITTSSQITSSPTPKKTLPVTGKVDYTATFVALASLLIFISFIY